MKMTKEKRQKNEIKVSGMINSLEWDRDGNITAIKISTEKEDYIIDPNGMGRNLFDYVGGEVAVVGKVSPKGAQMHVIHVTKYDLIDF